MPAKQKRRRFFGGKGQCWRHIINQFPPHVVYVEPFVGGASVLRNKLPAAHSIAVDINSETLGRLDVDGVEKVNQDSLLWLPAFFGDLFTRERVRVAGQWVDVRDVLVYADPPYPMESRRSDRKRYLFDCNEDSPKWHKSFLDVMTSLPCMVAVSTYPNDYYRERLTAADWRFVEFQSMTSKGLATEWLWMNYEQPEVLHDSRYLGEDKREREVRRRRERSMVRKFRKLTTAQRAATLSQLIEQIVELDGVDFGDRLRLFRSIGAAAWTGTGFDLGSLPWPTCNECGVGLMEGKIGLVCPNGHGKIQ